MRRGILLVILLALLAIPVQALDIQPPEAPDRVSELMPREADSFTEGVWHLVKAALARAEGPWKEAVGICLGAVCAVLLCSLVGEVSPETAGKAGNLACCCAVATLLLRRSDALLTLGLETAGELREYGALLLPVMTGAMAAQGGVTKSAALYSGTVLFNQILSTVLTRLMKPLLLLFLGASMANRVLADGFLEKLRGFLKWLMGWLLKGVLYAFSGLLAITGAVSGTADAAAVRAAKVTISTAVPVVGGILSEASELVLVSAGTLGSAAGVYGMLTVLALFSGPFLRIGIQYALLKGVSAFCSGFSPGGGAGLLEDFSTAMGLILAMVSAQTVMLLVSTLCFMKGVV